MSDLTEAAIQEPWFPHEAPRVGQADLIAECESVFEEKESLVACAPTGIGKTAAALTAAIRVARRSVEPKRILFLTSRQSQHRIAVDTIRAINEVRPSGQYPVTSADILGQKSMCVRSIRNEHPALFSRICAEDRRTRRCQPFLERDENLDDRIRLSRMHAEEIVTEGMNHQLGNKPAPICGWRLARDAASKVDVVIGDYNHLFQEKVREASMDAMGIDLQNTFLIIDEAHNLPERIRRGMRRTLSPDLLRDARNEVEGEIRGKKSTVSQGKHDEKLANLRHLSEVIRRWRQEISNWMRNRNKSNDSEIRVEAIEVLGTLDVLLEQNLSQMGSWTRNGLLDELTAIQIHSDDADEDISACERLSDVIQLLIRWESSTALAAILSTSDGESQLSTQRIITHLLDPGLVAGPILREAAGAVLMSGTLLPPKMYARELGIEDSRTIICKSPFDAVRRPVIVATDVTTRYARRDDSMMWRITGHIESLLEHAPGHIAIFAPSYVLLEQVVECGGWHGRNMIVEDAGWGKSEADLVLDKLAKARTLGEKSIVFGTYGGRLAEGIDYRDNLLCSVVCIGIPIPPPSVHGDALRTYIESQTSSTNSWKDVVVQPAINRVRQAMGRAIRKAEDRALILLLDERHRGGLERSCHGDAELHIESRDAKSTAKMAHRFFARHPEEEATKP